MKKVWSSREALMRYMRLEGWTTGTAVCHRCHNVWDTAIPEGTNEATLECPRCRARNSSFLDDEHESY